MEFENNSPTTERSVIDRAKTLDTSFNRLNAAIQASSALLHVADTSRFGRQSYRACSPKNHHELCTTALSSARLHKFCTVLVPQRALGMLARFPLTVLQKKKRTRQSTRKNTRRTSKRTAHDKSQLEEQSSSLQGWHKISNINEIMQSGGALLRTRMPAFQGRTNGLGVFPRDHTPQKPA